MWFYEKILRKQQWVEMVWDKPNATNLFGVSIFLGEGGEIIFLWRERVLSSFFAGHSCETIVDCVWSPSTNDNNTCAWPAKIASRLFPIRRTVYDDVYAHCVHYCLLKRSLRFTHTPLGGSVERKNSIEFRDGDHPWDFSMTIGPQSRTTSAI